jgi:hypothetical protein
VELLATNIDDDGLQGATAISRVVVARWKRWRRCAITRPELAVSASVCKEIQRHGRVISAGFGCRERGDRGVYTGGASLARGLGLRERDRIRWQRREAWPSRTRGGRWQVGPVIHLKHIYNFWCSMLVYTPFVLCTSWHFYAFSGTNLLTRYHSASSLFSAVFVFQKSYTGNLLGIGRNKSQTFYFSQSVTKYEDETEWGQEPDSP